MSGHALHAAPIYDITRLLSPQTAPWPGDEPFSFEHTGQISSGYAVNLTRITSSPHVGTHADAPYHVVEGGAHPADLPLDKYLGPAHVVSVARQHGGIVPADLDGHNLNGVQRLLIHTWVSELPGGQWPDDFPYPTVMLADWLAAQGGVLLGLDSPSMDAFDSKTLPCHHRLVEHGIVNLENLCLAGVPDGRYELIALPLKLAGVCGSPVRAVLRPLNQ
ncbi:cyclase family protein [Aggregatilinea lenta]|uniref:cyclase family protein n=1 Tax=Aggregatilinea lenta TaxID=913108 RepID=UPI000E5C4C9D|nr:cyclase family protein [Aggregatilinea lenta]